MDKRILSLIMTLLLVTMTVAFAGCGTDTSKLAGSASQITNGATDTSDEAADDQNGTADGEEAAQHDDSSDDAAGELRYDDTDFLSTIEPWSGQPYCEINGNVPDIEEIWATTQESLDPLDSLGRCGTANSCIGTDGMPTEPRGTSARSILQAGTLINTKEWKAAICSIAAISSHTSFQEMTL